MACQCCGKQGEMTIRTHLMVDGHRVCSPYLCKECRDKLKAKYEAKLDQFIITDLTPDEVLKTYRKTLEEDWDFGTYLDFNCFGEFVKYVTKTRYHRTFGLTHYLEDEYEASVTGMDMLGDGENDRVLIHWKTREDVL